MNRHLTGCVCVALVASSLSLFAADPADWRPSVRWRGFNVLSMFIKGGRHDAPPGTIPPSFGYRNPQEFREDDFQMMQDWGFNFVRIPLDYRYWIKDGDPERFDETAMGYIDRLIALGKRHGIHVQLNFHRAPGYMVARPVSETGDLWNDRKMQDLCAKHWAFFARRYRDIPNEELSFNLFNEPPEMDDAKYGMVARIMIDAIRREDPKRFIVSDGIGAHPCRYLFGVPGVGQAMRGYSPGSFIKTGKHWPYDPDAPTGVLAGIGKPRLRTPFVLENVPACDVELSFGRVSGAVTIAVRADGRCVGTVTLDAKEKSKDPKWSRVVYEKQWNAWQGNYNGCERVRLTAPAKRLELVVEKGDWIGLSGVAFVSPDGSRQAILPVVESFAPAQNFTWRFVGWDAKRAFEGVGVSRAAWRYPDSPGKEYLYRNVFREWEEAEKAGIFVFVGEFGIAPEVPHAVMLAWLRDNLEIWQERGWGWAVWGLFRDRYGCLDSGRKDIPLEDFRGHKLDRAMLTELQTH